jgi:hypothetical protein
LTVARLGYNPARMARSLREASGALLLLVSLGTLFVAVRELGGHDYVAAGMLTFAGIALLRAGVELLRPTVGE